MSGSSYKSREIRFITFFSPKTSPSAVDPKQCSHNPDTPFFDKSTVLLHRPGWIRAVRHILGISYRVPNAPSISFHTLFSDNSSQQKAWCKMAYCPTRDYILVNRLGYRFLILCSLFFPGLCFQILSLANDDPDNTRIPYHFSAHIRFPTFQFLPILPCKKRPNSFVRAFLT